MADSTKLMNLPVLQSIQNTLRPEREKILRAKPVECTDLSQRQIHGDVCTDAFKGAVWRIRASDCYVQAFI